MNSTDNITFDEIEINHLLVAVTEQLATTKWNPLDAQHWAQLVALKALEEKLIRSLDAIYDETHPL